MYFSKTTHVVIRHVLQSSAASRKSGTIFPPVVRAWNCSNNTQIIHKTQKLYVGFNYVVSVTFSNWPAKKDS